MREASLGKKRGEWVAYLRAVEKQKKARRYGGSDYDDGMCHGIIPFGAVHQWKSEADRRLADALGQPQAARIVGRDGAGAGMSLVRRGASAYRHGGLGTGGSVISPLR